MRVQVSRVYDPAQLFFIIWLEDGPKHKMVKKIKLTPLPDCINYPFLIKG